MNKNNKYCKITDFKKENSVEKYFIDNLIKDLGYKEKNIKRKKNIKIEKFNIGSKKASFQPDYLLHNNGSNLIIIDAKHPEENIDNWVEQCAHYSLVLKRKNKPVIFFILSNGLSTKLYKWDRDQPILTLDFKDFNDKNLDFNKLKKIISYKNIVKLSEKKVLKEALANITNFIKIKKATKEEAQKLFVSCHKLIWNQEKRSPNSAFIEFVKLIFVKLYNDKKIHIKYSVKNEDYLEIPKEDHVFSINWINSREKETSNPLNDILFKDLMEHLNEEVIKNKKKTIFHLNEKINLKPSTIKAVVKKLENVDLFGIDEDLNGRLFETFLHSTMRGKALGQFFTPRSIVELGVTLANIKVSEKHIDKVLDGCCGTGGFLIEALQQMRNKIKKNSKINEAKKKELIKLITNESLHGIDAALEPDLSKIARINMYLHNDGGSKVFRYDGLETNIKPDKSDNNIVKNEINELSKHLKDNTFDIILTNPPFSMWYEIEDEAQKEIVSSYELLRFNNNGKVRNRLRTSEMFIERYKNLLKPGGKLISVIDETILSSKDYKHVRDYIKKYFIIHAIVSLHGDAFQMSKARVKTALIYLIKKKNNEEQKNFFMYPSIYLGVDDRPITTPPSEIKDARLKAKEEISEILSNYDNFINNKFTKWQVEYSKNLDRLDYKSCFNLQGRFKNNWKNNGFEIKKIGDICDVVDLDERIVKPSDHPEKEFRILTITYEGRPKTDETRLGKNINYKKMISLKEGDLVFSEYNSFNGAIGYITKDFEGALASNSYTVVRSKDSENSVYLWSVLRTTEIRCDLLSSAVGMGRQTIDWTDIQKIELPFFEEQKVLEISNKILNSWEKEKEILQTFYNIKDTLNKNFNLETDESKIRFAQIKPPK